MITLARALATREWELAALCLLIGLSEELSRIPADYLRNGELKLTLFQREIKRLGRRHRAVVSRLYTPVEEPMSMDADPGP